MSCIYNHQHKWRQLLVSLVLLPLLFSVPTLSRAEAVQKPIRMVVTAAFVSEKGLDIYEKLARYLAEHMAADVKVVSNVTYNEADLLLKQGIIQVGFVCGLPYTQARDKGFYELVAMPVMALKKGRYADAKGYEDVPGKYYSYTIVRKDSLINSWQQLKGKSYAYNDQNSNSGYNMPRYKLVQLGAKSWEDWFSKVIVSGSHEESIRLVSQGKVDASSVDSLVLDYDRFINDPDALNVRIIEHLVPGGAGIPPVVINTKVNKQIKQELQKALLNMHRDPQGRSILDAALIGRFAPPDDSNYNDIRRMQKVANEAGFLDHAE